MESIEIKEAVKKAYTKVISNDSGCCSSECCTEDNMSESYNAVQGYVPDADYGLGCGIPTQFAGIKGGDTVLDLGSGAGNDAFIASPIVGESGRVIGVDMTEAMVLKANENKKKHGFKNVEFVHGDIENLPVESSSIDVALSNCVLNLVPDKSKAYTEIYRVLKNGGHFTISDIVTSGNLPDKIKEVAELYAGCISGAMDLDKYVNTIKEAGFVDVKIFKQTAIDIPESIFLKHITKEELSSYKDNKGEILSITIGGSKR